MKSKILLKVKHFFKLLGKAFQNLKMKYKLGAGFVLIIVLSIIVGIISISDMKKIQNNSEAVYNDKFAPIQILSALKANVEYERAEYIKILTEQDKAAQHLSNIKSKVDQDNTMLANYPKVKQSSDAKIAYENFQGSFEAYSKSTADLGNLINEKNFAEISTRVGNIDQNRDVVISKLDTLINTYKNEANIQNKENGSIFNKSISKVTSILLLVIILSILTGLYFINFISKSLFKLKKSADSLAIGDVNIDIKRTERKDEIGQLYNAFARMTDNIREQSVVAKSIAGGNFNTFIDVKSDKDVLGTELSSMSSSIKTIIDEIKKLIGDVEKGNTSKRIVTDEYKGGWKELTNEINKLLETFTAPLNLTAHYIDKISSGDIPDLITDEYFGDFNKIKNNLNNCIDVMNGLINETDMLIKAVEEGTLEESQNVDKYSGDWGKLLGGINKLIETFNSPIKYAAKYLVALGNGEDPGIVTDVYKGDFKIITDNLGFVRNSFNELFVQTINMTKKANEGDLSYRADTGNLKGSYVEIVKGINQTLDEIIKPINEAAEVLGEIAKGNLNSQVKGEYNGDFAIIKNSVNETAVSLREIIDDVNHILNEISKGNLKVTIDKDYEGDFKEISDSFKTIIESLNDTLRNIEIASQQVASGSKQVSDSSVALSQGASRQASSIEEITAAITEIAAQTKENAGSSVKANNMAIAARGNAEEGKREMSDMLTAVEDISNSSNNIGKIIKLIDEIAFQTNMLSLNAAVEAARAGEHGKGFAVVASEVRNLAKRSADAAKETENLILESIRKAEKGKSLAADASSTLNKIAEEVEDVTNLVGTITVSTSEQASGISQINEAIDEVSKVTQTNTATSEESAAASEELSNQANLLREKVDMFKLKEDTKKEMKLDEDDINRLMELIKSGEINIDPAELLE